MSTNPEESNTNLERLKQIIEGALLAAGKPLSIDHILSLFLDEDQPSRDEIRAAVESLQADCENRGVELTEVSTGYRYQVKSEFAKWVSRLWEEKPAKYSRAVLETLALIAYRQPITRGEIEDVRGVSVSSHIIKSLLEREWVRVVGHRDVPGKPALYGTTKIFLDYFSLKSLSELPPLAELRSIESIEHELDFGDGPKAANDTDESAETDGENQVEAEATTKVTDEAAPEPTNESDSGEDSEISAEGENGSVEEESAEAEASTDEIEAETEQEEVITAEAVVVAAADEGAGEIENELADEELVDEDAKEDALATS